MPLILEIKTRPGPVVKLYKTKDTYRAVCCVNNRRIRRSCTDPEKAEQLAMDIAHEVNKLTDPDLVMTHQERLIYKAVMQMLPQGVNLTDVVSFYLTNHKNAVATDKSVRELVKEYLGYLETSGASRRHRLDTKSNLTRFAEKVPVKLKNVEPHHIEEYLGLFKTPSTRNAKLRYVKMLFARAKLLGLLPSNENTAADKVGMVSIAPKDPGIITAAHLQQVLNAVRKHSPEILAAVCVKAFAGCRTAEVSRLTMGQVSLESSTITMASAITKTKRRRVVPIIDPLGQWLAVCPNINNPDAPLAPSNYHIAVNAALALEHVPPIPPNALRHTCATALLASGVNSNKVASIMGHSVAVLETHYQGLMTDTEADQYFNVRPQ